MAVVHLITVMSNNLNVMVSYFTRPPRQEVLPESWLTMKVNGRVNRGPAV